jgi:hypothetical protein
MGVRLIVEILDHWQDCNLTAGERGDLIVIAEQTSDTTRETVVSIHRPYVLKRAGKESAASWRNAIGKLMKKKVLEHAVQDGRKVMGHEGQTARYRIPYLCPLRDHDGLYGQCIRPESVISEVTLFSGYDTQEGHLTGDALDQEGHLTDASGSPERCAEGHLTGDPSPSYPSGPSKTTRKRAGTKGSAEPKPPNKHQVADDLTAAFWKIHGKGRTQPYIAVQKIVRSAIANGVERDDLARALDQVAKEGAIVGWKLDNALAAMKNPGSQRSRGGAAAQIPNHDDVKTGKVVPNV